MMIPESAITDVFLRLSQDPAMPEYFKPITVVRWQIPSACAVTFCAPNMLSRRYGERGPSSWTQAAASVTMQCGLC